MSDPCKKPREVYDACFQLWLDEEYFKGTVKGPMTPCESEMKAYHECFKADPERAKYLENLEKYKQDFPR